MPPSFDIRRHRRLGSTNDEARRLALAGAPAGTVVTATEQTAGRGRQGRVWHSGAGNLHASILLRPDVPPARLGELAFLAALAVAETVDNLLAPARRVVLKWPNDVLVDGAKIAGILIEQEGTAMILGIGINVAHHPPDTPYPATDLAAAMAGAGAIVAVETVLQRLLAALGTGLAMWDTHGFAPIRAAWLARAQPSGTALRVRLGAVGVPDTIEGHFAGLDARGALLLDTPAGQVRIVAGEVVR
ncbi:MAG: biotin--[acetyl-CoA-carboxylase] ligase [Rhodospirillales bacterium]|nr:biotin--[acetyl-CoA-carboxylase] ligase [Rhodospirillales bacterium]